MARIANKDERSTRSDIDVLLQKTRVKFPQLASLEIFRDFINCACVKRLEDISFLGAIEKLGPSNTSGAGSRLDHTIGVAYLAYLGTFNVNETERNTAIAAALLHDIGHGPLSHSSEPFFKKAFGIDHRTEGRHHI